MRLSLCEQGPESNSLIKGRRKDHSKHRIPIGFVRDAGDGSKRSTHHTPVCLEGHFVRVLGLTTNGRSP